MDPLFKAKCPKCGKMVVKIDRHLKKKCPGTKEDQEKSKR